MPDIVNGSPIVIFSIPAAVDINVAPKTSIPIPANMAIICGDIEI
jgi:hypothetical protein